MPSGIIALVLLAAAIHASDVIVAPSDTSKTHIGFVVIQGASIPADRYVPLAHSLQEEMKESISVFVGIPSFLLNTPDPLTISSQVNSVITQMKSAGMNANAHIFIAGHSLGGIVV